MVGLSVVAVLARFGVMSLSNPNGWWDAVPLFSDTAVVQDVGYVTVYLTSPYDFQSHIDSSLTRLLAQGWPMALFG